MISPGADTTRGTTSFFEGEEVAHPASRPEEGVPMLAQDKATRKSTQRIQFWLRAWEFEFMWLFFAFIVLGLVMALLGGHNGKPTPLWAGGITLNTIVSFGSMLFRVCLMAPVASSISQLSWIWLAQGERPMFDIVRFDRASRGLHGSLQLLWFYNIRSFAIIGAIVSILGLGIGPFFQQSLVFYTSAVLDSSAVAYATSASAYNSTIGASNDLSTGETGRTPTNMQNAIRSGLYPSFLTMGSQPLFSCPSSRCTWEPFPTLALGLQCRDVPQAFSKNCTRSDYCWIQSGSQPGNPSYLHLPKTGEHPNAQTVFFFAATQSVARSDSAVNPSSWDGNGTVELEWVRASDKELVNPISPGIGNSSEIESRRCTIQLKVQEISAAVSNGVYTEAIDEEYALNGEILTGDRSGAKRNTYHYTAWVRAHTKFSLLSQEYDALLNNVLQAFSGLEELSKSADRHIYKTLNGNLTTYTDSWHHTYGADALKALYVNSNTTDSVSSLIQQINFALRSYNSFQDIQEAREKGGTLSRQHISSKEQVPGQVYIDKVHARVRWAWFILPIALAILTTVLLVATAWLSRTANVGIWKESPLALLLFGRYEGDLRPISSSARDERQIRLLARDLTAQLTPALDTSDENLKTKVIMRRRATGNTA